ADRAVRRADLAGAARRRGAPRRAVRARARAAAAPRPKSDTGGVAGRCALAPPARRWRGLDAPRGDLDRQAVRSADPVRAPGPRRDARVRDAAAPADAERAGDPRARAGRVVRGQALQALAGALGPGAARQVPPALLDVARPG